MVQRLSDWMDTKPVLKERVLQFSEWYHDKMGYRKYGLKMDDLIPEDSEVVKEAMTRLSERELADRTFRQRRAMHLNMNHEILPQSEWIKPEEDRKYLYPHILDICKEQDEKEAFDRLKPKPWKFWQVQKKSSAAS